MLKCWNAIAIGESICPLFAHPRQRGERAVGTEYAIGGEHMRVWVEVGPIPEGLHEQDQAGPRAGGGRGVCVGEQARGEVLPIAW